MSLINNHYFVTLFNIASEKGMDLDRLARGVGVDRSSIIDKSLLVKDESLAKLMNILWQVTGDERMGLAARSTSIGTSGFIFEHMVEADTLDELFRRGQKACALLPDADGIDYQVENGTVNIDVRNNNISPLDPKHFLIEFRVAVWHRFACWATDSYISLTTAYFTYPQPDHLFCYDGLFKCPISFGAKATGFSFADENLSKPIVRSKKQLAEWLRQSRADVLSIKGRDVSSACKITALLAKELRTNRVLPSFAVTCKKLHITTHNAQSRLREEGSSYQKLKDAVRLELINEMLDNPDYSISQVSDCSGFTELATFTRAVKTMTGLSPVKYRQSRILKHGSYR
jgi:AraC-like DNA-binding protein